MKRIVILLIFGLLSQIVIAQSDTFSSFESMVGKTVYFPIQYIGSHNSFKIYTLEKGKYVAHKPEQLPFYCQYDGYIHIDGTVVNKKQEMIKATKGGTSYYFKKQDFENISSYIRNPEQWETEVLELNNNYNYYIPEGKSYAVKIKWSVGDALESYSYYKGMRYKANAANGSSCVDSLSDYGCSFSSVKSEPDKFMSKEKMLEWKDKLLIDLVSNDVLSELGLVLVGRFQNKSLRVQEICDSLFLFIGLADDTNGNLNLRYLVIDPRVYHEFEHNMSVVNEKFRSWAQIAKEDNVTNFKKRIPVDFNNEAQFFSSLGGTKSIDLFAVFEVDENGESSLRIDNWEEYDPKSASYESQMHSPYMRFYSPEAFSSFFELIRYDTFVRNYKRVKAFIDAKIQTDINRDSKFN